MLAAAQVPDAKSENSVGWDSFHAEQNKIRQRGTEALERERTRSKTDLCKTKEQEGGAAIASCLEAENRVTEQDYLTYVQAIGALLRLPTPDDADRKQPTKHLPFDEAEGAWRKYRDESCKSMATQWADVQSSVAYADCRLKLTWTHMNELDSLYSDLWH